MRRPRRVWLLLLALLFCTEASAARSGRTRSPVTRTARPARPPGSAPIKRTATSGAARPRPSVLRSLEPEGEPGVLYNTIAAELRAADDTARADLEQGLVAVALDGGATIHGRKRKANGAVRSRPARG